MIPTHIAARAIVLAVLFCLPAISAAANDPGESLEEYTVCPIFDTQDDLLEDVPANFTRFHFAGNSEHAQWLNRYLWYHFSHRSGNGRTLFNKEYLMTADLWLADAVEKHRKKPIQEVHREDILSMQMDSAGYVHTHQHYSHAHEHGWPFPLWTQSGKSPEEVAGKTAGWHFQSDAPGWVFGHLKNWKLPQYYTDSAAQGWELDNVESLGVSDNKWQLRATGPSPSITTPDGIEIDSFQAPFLQLRCTRSGEAQTHVLPYVEWLREGDTEFSADRRVYFHSAHEEHEGVTKSTHSMIEMHTHPSWTGQIKRIRICLAPGESDVEFAIDSFFTVYDTRHSINNPIFIFACWDYFRWTGDLDFLRANINKMRRALRYQQTVMGGLKYNHIRNPWPGHDGLPGYKVNEDGSKTVLGGHGIGNNYWDLLPFGGDDLYATSQYYAATLVMAELEEAIEANPGWAIPCGESAFEPSYLRQHAADVKAEANNKFWNPDTGRFVGWIDVNGQAYDYGFTFVNLDAVWYGLASDDHAQQIMDWIAGSRIVDGDTSTGADIYHWRFGPRATTRRNVETYGQGWYNPEHIPWGGQVQDGGAVLGFTFYDLWARLKVLGPDNAWDRLCKILDWEKEVWSEGGYRPYYKDGKHGTTLQGGGTAGGLGIDHEFYESSLLPAIVIRGFLGLRPDAAELAVRPNLPRQCPEIGVSDLLYRNVHVDIAASPNTIRVALKQKPLDPIPLRFEGDWRCTQTGESGSVFQISQPGVYRFQQVQN